MKKQSKEMLFLLVGLLLLLFLFIFYHVLDISSLHLGILSNEFVGFIFCVCILIIIYYLINGVNTVAQKFGYNYKEKMFNSLVKSSDTIYIMYDYEQNKLLYLTNNVNRVLEDSDKDDEKLETEKLKKLFDLSSVLNQINDWDKKSNFVSQMISYRSSSYQQNRWLKIQIYPIKDKKKLYYIVLISDVTKDHLHQHFLISQASDIKSREKKLNQITANVYDTELDVNLETGLSNFIDLKHQKEYDENLTHQYEEDLANNILKNISSEDKVKVGNLLSLENLKSITSDEPITIRYTLKNKEEKIWLESTVFFTSNKNEKYASILTKNVTEDAESVRKQNIMLTNALESAKKASEAKTEFVKTVSHSIRTPMTAIMGLSETILEEKLSKEIKEDVQDIHNASENILSVIDELLDIEKVESGKITVDNKEYNIDEVIKNVFNITKQNIQKKDIKIKLKVNKNIPNILKGDSNKITQILLNLLDNAVKFTDQGSIIIGADCERINSKAKITMYIQDTGIGMTSEEIDNLIKDTDSNRGLTITSKVVKALKGQMDIYSKEGIGTRVTVTLDQEIIDDKPIGNINELQEKVTEEVVTFNDKKVLLVDDDKISLKVTTKFLSKYGITTKSVVSGKDAIKEIEKNNYDLILLDQKMPDMDGITTLKEMKNKKDFNTPVVVLTADAIKGVKEKYINEGFNDYLSKPINMKFLTQILKKYLK